MKRILFLLAAILLPATLFGQGQVIFLNNAATPIRTNHGPAAVGNVSGVDAYRIGLYIAPFGTVNESLFTLVVVATNSSLAAGRIGGGGGVVDIPGNNGTPIAFQVRAWSLFAGATYNEAITNGAYKAGQPVLAGRSPVGGVTPATGAAPPPTLFSSTAGIAEYPGQLTSGFDLLGAPEPSTYALAVLGFLMLFCCRKRKATN